MFSVIYLMFIDCLLYNARLRSKYCSFTVDVPLIISPCGLSSVICYPTQISVCCNLNNRILFLIRHFQVLCLRSVRFLLLMYLPCISFLSYSIAVCIANCSAGCVSGREMIILWNDSVTLRICGIVPLRR